MGQADVTALFSRCPPPGSGPYQPRPYQREAIDALDAHLRDKTTSPCVVLPTGAGKSLVIAWAIQRWKHEYQPLRVCVLAHREELVKQNHDELSLLWPNGDIGIYAAGLKRRDVDAAVVFASIDSIYKRWGEFPAFDVIFVDEAHRIPARGEGKYRTFIKGCQSVNPRLKVVGMTATPYRMGMGAICHKDHILQEICYEANVGVLISQGFLCKLRSKVGDVQPDLSNVRKSSRGEYVQKALAEVVEAPALIRRTVDNAMRLIRAENRQSVVWFCIDVAHAKAVAKQLWFHGIDAPCITGKTHDRKRKRAVEGFKAGHYQHLCNVNVYTEGFNARRVDCIVLLRPTESKGLYAQMCGRGLRLHPSKSDCLVLDFARCIETHGPIDGLEAERVRTIVCGSLSHKCALCEKPEAVSLCRYEDDGIEVKICAECDRKNKRLIDTLRPIRACGDTFSRAIRVCPNCGWEIPKQEVEREEAAERKRKMHEAEASRQAILGSEPTEVKVDAVTVHRHRKAGKPDSLRVEYRCGLSTHREWICLAHGGYAEQKARVWWSARFNRLAAKQITLDAALADMTVAPWLTHITESITVVRRGKRWEIIGHKLRLRG